MPYPIRVHWLDRDEEGRVLVVMDGREMAVALDAIRAPSQPLGIHLARTCLMLTLAGERPSQAKIHVHVCSRHWVAAGIAEEA